MLAAWIAAFFAAEFVVVFDLLLIVFPLVNERLPDSR
jgi:hypothetical protein